MSCLTRTTHLWLLGQEEVSCVSSTRYPPLKQAVLAQGVGGVNTSTILRAREWGTVFGGAMGRTGNETTLIKSAGSYKTLSPSTHSEHSSSFFET